MNIPDRAEWASSVMRGEPSERTPAAIGRRIRATREALGLNQRDVHRRTGIAPNTYNQWEKGRGRPSLPEAIKLADGLDISLDWIYFGDPSRLPFDLATAIMRAGRDTPQ